MFKIQHSEDYRKLRRQAYPAITDQLDAMVKFADALAKQGLQLPPEVSAWVDQCKAVKARYKKPT